MSNSVRPHRRQPTRLPRPWDSPGKNTGVACHFLLQCMKGKSESEVPQSILSPWKCHIQHTLQWERIWLSRVIQYGVPLLSRLSWPLRLQVRSDVSSVRQTETEFKPQKHHLPACDTGPVTLPLWWCGLLMRHVVKAGWLLTTFWILSGYLCNYMDYY